MMDYDENNPDWGPWQDHDQSGCPLTMGMVFQPIIWVRHWGGDFNCLKIVRPSVVTDNVIAYDAWSWSRKHDPLEVVRYRVLPPKSLHRIRLIAQDIEDAINMREFINAEW